MRSSVDEIDEVRDVTFERLPDRPDGGFVRRRRDVPPSPAELKALQRLRTAAWRLDNDRRGRPTTDQIARALLVAICASSRSFEQLVDAEVGFVRDAVDDMIARGFVRSEIEDVMRHIRRRVRKTRQDSNTVHHAR